MKNYIRYYGLYLLIFCALAGVAAFFLADYHRKRPEEALFVLIVDANLENGKIAEFRTKLAEALGINEAECIVDAAAASRGNTALEASALAYLESGRVDLLIAKESQFNSYAVSGLLKEQGALSNSETDGYYAARYDYSNAGAVTEFPFAPHDKEHGTLYGFYLSAESLSGFAVGVPLNAPHESLAQKALAAATNL
jgi:hypothetical protein